jgi:hypothetical protein
MRLLLSDSQNYFKLSYESIEKAEILNIYFSSISNLNDENKVLPDFAEKFYENDHVFVSLFSKWNQSKLCRHFL